VEDGRFALMRLFAEPELSLSDALTAQSFSATPGDDSLPWHLHVILSRCLRVRDFADRQSMDGEEDEDEEDIGGSSSSITADRLTSGYASQLEALGRVEEAVFVLLHLKHSLGRQKAIKDLLSRQVSKFGEYPSRLMQECKIPRKWLEEAKAVHAQGRDDLYAAWQHYLAAEMWDDAHDVAVKALAPEAVVCHDMTLLHELFERMIDKGVRRWTERGQVGFVFLFSPTIYHIEEFTPSFTGLR
jgi:nuclear pore complex protein Nup98-Nup96